MEILSVTTCSQLLAATTELPFLFSLFSPLRRNLAKKLQPQPPTIRQTTRQLTTPNHAIHRSTTINIWRINVPTCKQHRIWEFWAPNTTNHPNPKEHLNNLNIPNRNINLRRWLNIILQLHLQHVQCLQVMEESCLPNEVQARAWALEEGIT